MALPFLAIGASLLGKLKSSKLEGVQAGTKTVTKPKTVFGKLFGSVTGRTQAYNLQEEIKASNNSNYQPQPVQNTMFQNSNNGVSGSVQFGEQTKQANIPTLALIGGVLIAVVYFITNKPKRRR